MKTFICLFLTIAWIFNKFVYRLCFTEHQNFSSLPAKIFWSIWFFNKSSQHCFLSARMIKEDFYDSYFWRQTIYILSTLCWLTRRFQNQMLLKKFCSDRSGSRTPFPILVSKFYQSFCSGIPQISLFVHILHSIITRKQINLPIQCLHIIQIFTGLNFKILSKNIMCNLNEQESNCTILKAKPSCYWLNVVL